MKYLIVVALLLQGCATQHPLELEWKDGIPTGLIFDPRQSWDQANLKQHDNTCATMVYHVNHETGLLEQC